MYGKHFESMYEGSMYGAGCAVFAVWGYVISHARAGVVELNPKKLKDTLGAESVAEVAAAIGKLEGPDPESRHKECEGRRLVKEGEYQYRVPSWEYYQGLRDAADLREYNREAKRRSRAKKKVGTVANGTPMPGETAAVRHGVEMHEHREVSGTVLPPVVLDDQGPPVVEDEPPFEP